jgi:YHS domain-containing protein
MDAEALKTLGSLLLWGALFFFMMRFGCGAHIMGGHGHGGHGGSEPGAGSENKEPVCGMTVNPQSAAAAAVHEGRTHYFCSTSCRDKFEQAPENYAGVPGPTQGGHHHG